MAAPTTGRRLVHSVHTYAPALFGIFSKISERFFRTRDKRRGSSLLLLAPLLAEAAPMPLACSRPPGSTGAEGLHSCFRWIADHVPAFKVPGGRVHVLHSPDEFYQAMKVRIKTAKHRVVMASLYLGTGPLEQDLVDCIEEALQRSQEEAASGLKVSVLLDYTRGSRGKSNSRTMLLPLLQRYPEQTRVALYHTPDLRGLLRLLVPNRFNETIGVQHIKAYLFDNSLIISGANLSESYFTNRQDRYLLVEDCGEVADFFAELVRAVSDISLQLEHDDTVHVVKGMVHPYKGNRADFSSSAHQRVMEVLNVARARQQQLELEHSRDSDSELECGEEPRDTWLFPLVQMKPLGIQLDEEVTQRLLAEAGGDSTVYLTSGYFNLTQTYMRLVLGAAADYRILMASPEVNGFFGAKGVAGAIPEAYVHLAHQFYSKVCTLGQQGRVRLHEYHRPDWTFHAKGLWYYLKGKDRPSLTLIGSPNFGYRSVHRDLEAQIALVTENEELQAQLQQEQGLLYQRSTEVSNSTFQQPDRYVKLWVKLITPLIKNFF
ncbi:CDP-diacylglycerol--glycerol-3-phosphate 3-phosphatidyltransferase, mitochondrial [Brachyhypopomus gauderio]|uniref:CDP-diacylglycerol--glycerol-3-phosphate 3-phosphatidyltransferase, mitochondrial n=1 Tax=Brachyhypopomus gauderio TaxID=698409 RepID=UPI004041DF50